MLQTLSEGLGSINTNAIPSKIQHLQALGVLQTLSEGLGSIIANAIPFEIQCQQAVGVLQTLSEGLGSINTNAIPCPRFSVCRLLECRRPSARALAPSACQCQFPSRFSVCRLLECCRPSARALAPSAPMPFLQDSVSAGS